MKKISLLAAFLVSFMTAQAQTETGLEIGLKVSPCVATNRFVAPSAFEFENENAKFRGSFGLVFDYYFSKNYAFNTGLEYSVKGGKISFKPLPDSPTLSGQREVDELNIQYLAVPLGLILFTNNIGTDTRV